MEPQCDMTSRVHGCSFTLTSADQSTTKISAVPDEVTVHRTMLKSSGIEDNPKKDVQVSDKCDK